MKKSLIFCLLVVFIGLNVSFPANSFAQIKTKPAAKKKKTTRPVIVARPIEVFKTVEGSEMGISSASSERPKYLSLEPCGKETPEQIAEVENAKDAREQVAILTGRLMNKDEWIRGCAIYRLGEFKALSSPALPLIFKLLRDDETDGIFNIVLEAIYKIPPAQALQLHDYLRMAKETDVYNRIYGLWALGYYIQSPGTFELKDSVATLIEATKDDDTTVRWIALKSITLMGANAKDAVPALIDVIKKNDMNPLQAMYALGNMGQYMLPAVPLLFDILYHPEKYAKNNNQKYALYSISAMNLGRLGKDLIPVLEKEFDNDPAAILQIAKNLHDGDTSAIIIKALNHPNRDVRESALNWTTYTDFGAAKILPFIVERLADPDPKIRQNAVDAVSEIAINNLKSSPEVAATMKQKALPALVRGLQSKDDYFVCKTISTIGNLAANVESAIPVLVRTWKQKTGYPNSCAEEALFDLGDKGRKFLFPEQIKKLEEREKSTDEYVKKRMEDRKVKAIEPKPVPKPQKIPDSY